MAHVPFDETTILKEHVRNAEEAVQRKRAAFAELAAEASRLGAERDRAQADVERFEHDAELALNGNRRDLARYALKLLLPRKRAIDGIERRLVQVNKEQKEVELVLARQQGALDELRARVQAYLSDHEALRFASDAGAVTDEQIDLELLRRLKRRESALAPKDASAEEDRETA
jgi:phage shock protein A